MINSASPIVPARNSKVFAKRGSVLLLGCVVAFARLYLPVLVVGPYFDFAEGAVLVGIGGCVADRVLAAHLVLKLAECVLQGHLPVDMEYVTAGFLRHAPQL